MADRQGRGEVATRDMKARIRSGWDVSDLWDRMRAAERGDGYEYDMADLEVPRGSVENVA